MNALAIINQQISESVLLFQNAHRQMQTPMLKKLRLKLTERVDDFKMPIDRRSYLLHQVSNCHTIEELGSLLQEINHAQFTENTDSKLDLLTLSPSHDGMTILQHHG